VAQSQGGANRGGSTTTNPENKTKENRDLLVGTKAQVYGTLIAAALLAILGAIVKWVAPVNRLVWPPIASAVSTITRWLSEPVLLHLWSAIVIGLALMVFGASYSNSRRVPTGCSLSRFLAKNENFWIS
jgi:hypothetical protein